MTGATSAAIRERDADRPIPFGDVDGPIPYELRRDVYDFADRISVSKDEREALGSVP